MNYRSIYEYLYEDQLVAAEEDYEEWFRAEYGSCIEETDWNNEEYAENAIRSLLNELFEDRDDVFELCENAGLPRETLEAWGYEEH